MQEYDKKDFPSHNMVCQMLKDRRAFYILGYHYWVTYKRKANEEQ